MSWNELSRTSVPCPCGAGRVVTSRLMNENRHLRKRSWLDCEVCRSRDIESWNEERSYQEQQSALWMKIRQQIQTAFQEKYHQEWIDHFALCGSKKAVWEILREADIIHNGLTRFYEELRIVPLPYYLNHLPNPDNIHMILLLLEIEDEELLRLLRMKYDIELNINKLNREED